jgi:DNA repair photolyase
VCIQTKSSLIQRDVDIIQKFSNAEVMISIGTFNDTMRKVMEPHSPSIHQRIDTLYKCSNTGITTKVFFGPIYPDITKKMISDILTTFADAGASQVMIDNLNTKPGIIPAIQKQSNAPCFKEWITSNTEWYDEIKKEIHHVGKQLDLSIVDAF